MPGKRILLVDHDVDALSELASALRDHGLSVSFASGAQMACDRAKSGAFDVIVAARAVAEPDDGSLGVLDTLSVELAHVPPMLVLVEEETGREDRVLRGDVVRLVGRIDAILESATRGSSIPPARPSLVPSSHALESGPLGDLLVVLATEKRAGTITMTTAKGSGEIRLVDGEVADAVYVRLEGVKAITRMLAERDGTATFAPGAPAIMRRITVPTRRLVEDARRLAERAMTLRKEASDLSGTLIAVDARNDATESTSVDEHVLTRLRVPATLDELLDELPHADAEVLASALALHGRGRIKVLGHASSRAQLCGADQLHLVRASAARARSAGFAGAARLVFAATPSRLAVLGHTVLSLADAVPARDPIPALPVPCSLATLRLGDGVELDVVALPLVPAYAPLWPMALAGAAVVVRLDDGAAQPLEEACGAVAVPVLDAAAFFGVVDESSPVQIASLIRTALEANPG